MTYYDTVTLLGQQLQLLRTEFDELADRAPHAVLRRIAFAIFDLEEQLALLTIRN